LPGAEPRAAGSVPPRSSATAVHTGVALAYCGAIERLVAETLRAARGPATVVITGGAAGRHPPPGGGGARHPADPVRTRARRAADLVHQGLRLLAAAAPCGS